MEIGYKTETQILVDILLFRINTNTKMGTERNGTDEEKTKRRVQMRYVNHTAFDLSLWLLEK